MRPLGAAPHIRTRPGHRDRHGQGAGTAHTRRATDGASVIPVLLVLLPLAVVATSGAAAAGKRARVVVAAGL